jgi:hypothetical protein
LTVGKVEDWLASGGKSPREHAEKGRFKELLGNRAATRPTHG